MRRILSRWFYAYNRIALALSSLLVVGSLAVIFLPSLARYKDGSILLYVVLGLAAMQLIFSIAVIRRATTMPDEDPNVSKLTGMLNSRQMQSEILIQSITDGVVVVNNEGIIGLMNPSAATMTGWSVQEAVSLDVRSVMSFAKEDGKPLDEAEPFTYVLTTQKSYDKTVQLMSRDKSKSLIISLVVSPVVSKGTALGAVAVFRDVSAAKEEEKRRADFISTASHEMRTPVAAIEGYLALALNDKVSSIDTRARDYLQKAHSSTQHLGQLFQDLLTSAKAEDGRLTNHPVVVEMGEFLEKLTEDLRFSAQKKGLLMEYTFGTNQTFGATVDASQSNHAGPKVVHPLYYTFVDPDRVREVITNIFDNAVKYTETGKVAIGLTGDKDVVQVYVRDTGPGIPADDVPHLFQKFYRVDNSATRTIGGTGLGLFICKKIIELYKGRIWVESQVGQGSTFYINLPRIDTQRATQLQTAEASKDPNLAR